MGCFHSSEPRHKRLAAWERMGSENQRWGVKWGVRWRQAGCGGGGCLLWALISWLGVWRSTGDFFFIISSALFLVNLFSKYISAWLTQTIWQFCRISLFPQFLPLQCCNDRLCHGYRAWLWLVRWLSTISIRKHSCWADYSVLKRIQMRKLCPLSISVFF